MATQHPITDRPASADLGVPTRPITQTVQIMVTDAVGESFPLMLQANTAGRTWGHGLGETQGRLLRFEDFREGAHFYDFGIDQNGSLFITQQGTATANTPRPGLTISPHGALAFGTSGGPTLAASPAGSLTLDSSLTVDGFLTVDGVVAFKTSLTVSGGVTLENLPTDVPAGAMVVMIDSDGNLYAQPQ